MLQQNQQQSRPVTTTPYYIGQRRDLLEQNGRDDELPLIDREKQQRQQLIESKKETPLVPGFKFPAEDPKEISTEIN